MTRKFSVLSAVLAAAIAGGRARGEGLPSLPSMESVKDVIARTADEIGHVWMTIRPSSHGDSYTIEDPFLRVRVEASRSLDDFRFAGWVDQEYFRLESRRIFHGGKDHVLSGPGTYLELRRLGGFGKDYALTGDLAVPGQGTRRVDVMFRYDEYRKAFFVSGSGLSLTFDTDLRLELNGSADFKLLPKTGLTAAACAAALIADDLRPQRRPIPRSGS